MSIRKLTAGIVFLLLWGSPLWANWGVVQQTASPQTQGATISGQFPTSVTAGDLILVQVIWSSTTTSVTSITDTLGNTYISAALAQGSTSTQAISTQLFYAANVKGGTDQVTVTIGGSTFFNIFLYEIAGAATANPLDVTATGNGTGFLVSTGTVTTTAANDFVFVGTGHHYGYDTTGSGFTGLQAAATGLGEYQTAAFAGTSTSGSATLSNINASLPWSAVLAAFKSNSGSVSVVTPTLTSIQVTPSNPTLSMGQSLQLSAVGTYSDGSMQNLTNSVTWGSSNAAVASVGGSGLATANGHGTSTITAASGSVSGSTPLLVEGTLTSLQITPSTDSLTVGTAQQFTATGTFSDSTTENLTNSVSWSSSNTSVATISSSGLANAVSAGSSNITAISGGLTASASLTIVPPVGVVSTPVTQTPLVQTNAQWSVSYFMQAPPTSGGNSCSPAPCIAQTFLNPNTVGNMIFVWVSWNTTSGGITLANISDSAGNTYTHIPGFPSVQGVADDFWVAYNINANASNKVVASFTSGTTVPVYLQIMEYSGAATSNAFDVSSISRKHIQCVAPCVMSSAPSPITSQASELVVTVFDVSTGSVLGAGNGWTPEFACFACLNWETDVSGQVLIEHQVVTSTGSYTATFTDATSAWPAYSAYLFTFKMAQ